MNLKAFPQPTFDPGHKFHGSKTLRRARRSVVWSLAATTNLSRWMSSPSLSTETLLVTFNLAAAGAAVTLQKTVVFFHGGDVYQKLPPRVVPSRILGCILRNGPPRVEHLFSPNLLLQGSQRENPQEEERISEVVVLSEPCLHDNHYRSYSSSFVYFVTLINFQLKMMFPSTCLLPTMQLLPLFSKLNVPCANFRD